MQRTRKGRNGCIAMKHTTKTTNIRPSIPRMRKKRGESWSTNKAGTAVTIAKIVSPIQSSIFSIQSNRRFSRQLYQHQRAGGGVGTAEPPQYRMLLAAVHESGNGTSRRFPVAHRLGRYWRHSGHECRRNAFQGSSVRFTDEISALQRRLIVIPAFAGSLRQLDLRVRDFLVGNRPQDVRYAIEPPAPLVVGPHDVPRRVLAVCLFQHYIARPRVVVPAPVRFEVHWAQLPLPERVVDASGKSPFLLVLFDLQPDFDQDNAAIDDVFFHRRAKLEKIADLLRAAKSHDRFDAGALLPAAVEHHDLARRREPLDIALHVHLCLFTIRGSRKRHHAKHARANALGDGLDGSALAGGIAPLEHDDDPRALILDPILHMAKLDLKLAQFLLVGLALHLHLCIAANRPFLCHDVVHFIQGTFANADC